MCPFLRENCRGDGCAVFVNGHCSFVLIARALDDAAAISADMGDFQRKEDTHE